MNKKTQTYILTSKKFTGSIFLEFDWDGILIRYDMSDAALNARQKQYMLREIPVHISNIKTAFRTSKTAKLRKLKKTKVTFDEFWDRYDSKSLSSKKKSRQKWNRMSRIQRDKAYAYIREYERSIPGGIRKKYAETYLNSELWNN